jgi:hypothetical protein
VLGRHFLNFHITHKERKGVPMDEPTSKLAFNKAAPRRIVKVSPKPRKPKSSKTKQKTYRPTPISEQPLIKLDPASLGSAPVLSIDVEEYLHHFKDFVMTEDEKLEVLNDLWNIMCRFVEIGFGMDSHTPVNNVNATLVLKTAIC